jgi:hypothetical protein
VTSFNAPANSQSEEPHERVDETPIGKDASFVALQVAVQDNNKRSVNGGGFVDEHMILEEVDLEHLDDDEDDDLDYYLPTNSTHISASSLASLPLTSRKGIIEEMRRQERISSRSTYIPVADNPELYSQQQLTNFLKTRYHILFLYPYV